MIVASSTTRVPWTRPRYSPSAPPPGPLATAAAAPAAPESCATMALLRVLAFDQEGRPVAFDTWHDDLQLYLLSDNKDSVSLFDHVSGAALAPSAIADGSTRSQWLSCDDTARLAIHNPLPVTECAHFGEHRRAQALYDAVVARYSSPATDALGRLLLPYLFPELSAFATVADLATHLRSGDARYRAVLPAEFLAGNPPPMYITLYFEVTRLPDSLRSVRDHFLTLDPSSLTADLLEQHLLAAETSAVAVGAARGTLRSPFFEGTSVLLRLVRSAATAKAKGGRGGGGGSGGGGGGIGSGGGGSGRGGGGSGGGGGGGTGGCSGGSGGGGGGSGGSGGSGGGGTGGDLLRSGVAIFDLDYDAILSAMYALSFSAEGIAAAALGASASGTPPGTAPAEALHTFTLDFGASRCFFRDSTTLTPLPAPIPVGLADPSGGPVVARSSTVLLCLAVPSGSLSGLHLPSFSTNLVSTAALQDAMVTTTTPGGQRVSICTCTRTRRHLATFTRRPGSSLYTLATEPPQVVASAQVSTSGQVATSCSCRLLSHQTLLRHHRLGHPSLPRLRGMHSRLLVSGLPRSLPPLPPSPALPCLPCVEGRQHAAPHSSSFPPTTAPLQTLHMDVWGPARVCGQGRERYFLLVVDEYERYTKVFPLCSKGEFSDVLIPWIRTVRLQLRERFGQDLLVLRLHSDRGGEFSSDLLRDFVVGRAFSSLMEVARTSMIHAAAPHFLWPFAVQYATHQLNLWPRVSLPETSPTLRWTGKVGDVSVFRRLFPYRSAPPPPPPLFLAPGPPPVDPVPPQGPARSGVSHVDPLPGIAPVQVAVGSGAAPGAASRGAASGGAEPGGAGSEGAGSGGAEPGGAEPQGVEPGGAESEGAESGRAEPRGAASSGGPAGASPRLSSLQLHEWLVRRAHRRSGAPISGGAGDTKAGGAGAGVAEVGGPGAGGLGAVGAGVGGTGARGTGAVGAGAVDPVAGGAGDTVRPRPYFVSLLQQVLGVPSSTSLTSPLLCPPLDQTQPPLHPASPLPAPSPYTEQSGSLTERREPASRPVSLVCTARRAPRSRPPPVPGTHTMALRPSSVPLRVPLPSPPESSQSESAAASALVAELRDFAAACRLDYASALVAESVPASPPSIGGECVLGTDVLEDRQEEFECLVVAVPHFASMLLAPEGDPDAPDIPTPRSYVEAITGPYSSQWQAAMDAEMASWKSTGTYIDAVPPYRANIVDGMWIFRVKWLPGSPPAFKARFVA
ncbi:unnamed protein product [Closterium sp. NIES-54]